MAEPHKDAEAIFLASLDKTNPQERGAYVEASCAGDPELLRRVMRGKHQPNFRSYGADIQENPVFLISRP